MPSYETLDAIADAYNPLLASLALLLVAVHLFRKRWRSAAIGAAAFALVALIAFGLMIVDKRLGIWSSAGLDYSTHTATALGLTLLLSFEQCRWKVMWFGSFIAYLLLMLYQHYHTVADIVTTALVVGPLFGVSLIPLYRFVRRS